MLLRQIRETIFGYLLALMSPSFSVRRFQILQNKIFCKSLENCKLTGLKVVLRLPAGLFKIRMKSPLEAPHFRY